MGKDWDSFGDMRQPFKDDLQVSPGPMGRMKVRPSGTGSYVKDPRPAMRSFQSWCETWGTEAYRSLKPGGYLLSFGGTRTYHRLTAGLEDAGFEIRDCLMWLYGSGFPKSLNLPGGLGTALKPAWEPIVIARKPLDGTVEQNVTRYGTGAMNIDETRVGESKRAPASPSQTDSTLTYGAYKTGEGRLGTGFDTDIGRWPANLILSHHPDCVYVGTFTGPGRKMNRYTDGLKPFGGGKGHPSTQETTPDEPFESWDCTDDCPVKIMDQQSGDRPAGGKVKGTEPSHTGQGGIYGVWERVENSPYNDTGGASRFFYCAKTTRTERGAGVSRENDHPTVKPIELMRYLVRLVTPADGVVLDCFLGSGTTAVAALLEHRTFIGIEREPDYMKIAKERVQYWQQHGEDGWRIAAEKEASEARQERVKSTGQLNLMDAL
jgi:site-specific DNA-methyltransferase (adenine-specific)